MSKRVSTVYIKLFSLRRVYPQRADYELCSAVISVHRGTAVTTHHRKSKVRKLRLFLASGVFRSWSVWFGSFTSDPIFITQIGRALCVRFGVFLLLLFL